MREVKKKTRRLLMVILACVMLISLAAVSFGVYNNQSKADVAQQNSVVKELDNSEEKDAIDVEEASEDKESVDADNKEEADVDGKEETEEEQNYINPKEVRFMQSSIKNQTGEHTVLGNAEALKKGTLKPEDMPFIRLWKDKDGKIWTLDHRRLAAFKLAGLESVPFVWATEEEVANQMWKMTTYTDGKSIRLKLGKGESMTVQ